MGSAATRTCGGSWRPLSRRTIGSSSSITWAPAGRTSRPTAAAATTRSRATPTTSSTSAARWRSDRFDKLILVGPSPRYIDDADYTGGFSREDIEGLLDSLDSNYLGWSSAMAPVIMGNPDRPALGAELTNSFCRTNPEIARHFARVTFLSDNRADLPKLTTRSLILQCSEDVIAPRSVGEYVHRQIPGSELVHLAATGHCPNLSAPEETIAAIRSFL